MVSLTNFRAVGELALEGSHPENRFHLATTTTDNYGGHQSSTSPIAQNQRLPETHQHCNNFNRSSQKKYQVSGGGKEPGGNFLPNLGPANQKHKQEKAQSGSGPRDHFEIRWTNLNYQVEPKWYQHSLSGSNSSASSSTESTLAGDTDDHLQQQQHQKHENRKEGKGYKGTNDSRKTILNNLNGSVKSGQVTAVLGPSGAGKTSLLSCLTGKNKSGVSGCVQINSAREEPMSICQIPQKDFLLNQLTVRENLWFASRLKHPEEPFDHDSNIERVIDLLKLDSCIDTKISKISGGQYKRVSIAQELLSNPDILILDEPTSGLDSLTCYKTVMVLRDLARKSPNPMAIIVTIHQPQREVFDLFEHVYILAVGGRCIYEGPPSQSIRTINQFSAGLHFDADQYNPASYLVEIASAEFGEKPIEALVEHQRRDFRQRSMLQDQQNAAAAEAVANFNLLNGIGTGNNQLLVNGGHTPALRKRPSPMVARFKSTLASLTGSSPRSSPRFMHQDNHHHQNQQHLYAYTNEAYDMNQASGEQVLAPSYLEATLGQQASVNNGNLTHQQQQTHSDNTQDNTLILPMNQLTTTNSQATCYGSDDGCCSYNAAASQMDEGEFYLDERLQTHKHNHKGHFLRHCQLLTKRSWLCLCKDPMLTTLRFSAHIIVPLLITLVYGGQVGKPNACPLYETEMDLIDYARRGASRLLNLQDELRCTFENVGLYFLSIYAFTFSTMCLTSLSFPLNMHVLLKEVRNGWYSIPTYFIGKTLADFPLEFILPTLTLMITYPLTGQPSSYLEWRFMLGIGVFVVTSLIAQTQGLIFGALFMNAMQAAVFVAPVSTTPLILLSGFLIRISQMPLYLQKLSSLSYFRYAIESLTIIRYGFGQCPCDPSVVTGEPVSARGVPEQLKTMTNYWLSTFESASPQNDLTESGANGTLSDIVTATTASSLLNSSLLITGDSGTPDMSITTTEAPPVDFFQDLTVLLARANSFGADIKTCKDLKPYPMIDFSLEDNQLYVWLGALVATLIVSKIVNYYVVKYSVKWRL